MALQHLLHKLSTRLGLSLFVPSTLKSIRIVSLQWPISVPLAWWWRLKF